MCLPSNYCQNPRSTGDLLTIFLSFMFLPFLKKSMAHMLQTPFKILMSQECAGNAGMLFSICFCIEYNGLITNANLQWVVPGWFEAANFLFHHEPIKLSVNIWNAVTLKHTLSEVSFEIVLRQPIITVHLLRTRSNLYKTPDLPCCCGLVLPRFVSALPCPPRIIFCLLFQAQRAWLFHLELPLTSWCN